MESRKVLLQMMVFSLIFLLPCLTQAQIWQKIEMHFPPGDSLLSGTKITFATKEIGWIVTSGPIDHNILPTQYATRIFKTTDGGHHWVLQYSSKEYGGGYIFAVDSLHCWAYGGGVDAFLVTFDGGANWVGYDTPKGIQPPYFFNTKHGITLSDVQPWFTANGGKSWFPGDSSQANLRYIDITFVNSKIGWAVSDYSPFSTDAGDIIHTRDGGKTWQYQDSVNAIMYGIDFVDSITGYAVGTNLKYNTGFIYSTTDGGNHWTYKQDYSAGAMFDVGFLDRRTGWITGQLGKIWRTIDGGINWTLQNADTKANLIKIIVLHKEKTAYIFGGRSTGYSGYTNPFVLLHADLSNLTRIERNETNTPGEIQLMQNYPNPFNNSTVLTYQLSEATHVTLKIYNLLGRSVEIIVKGYKNKGIHTVYWNASGLASGVYILHLQTPQSSLTRKITLIK